MSIMKKTLLLFIILFSAVYAFGQDFPYGEVDNAALNMKKYDKDTSAHAVVVNEYGTSRINLTNDYHVRLTFDYHTKIKFFDNKDFESEGTFVIPVYSADAMVYEEVSDVKGITFYKDENGTVQQTELDPKKIITEKRDKHYSMIKFTMPALRSGCVIEVSYHFITPYFRHFYPWEFQSYIPKMYSEYEVHIPGLWNFNASLRGYLKLTKNTAKIESKCFTFGSGSADCSNIVYGISDIPAFKPEDFMTSERTTNRPCILN